MRDGMRGTTTGRRKRAKVIHGVSESSEKAILRERELGEEEKGRSKIVSSNNGREGPLLLLPPRQATKRALTSGLESRRVNWVTAEPESFETWCWRVMERKETRRSAS